MPYSSLWSYIFKLYRQAVGWFDIWNLSNWKIHISSLLVFPNVKKTNKQTLRVIHSYVPFGLTLHPRCSFCIKNQTKPYIQKPTRFPKAFNNNVGGCTKNTLLESCFIITSIVNPSYSQLYLWIKIIRELCTWLHYLGPLQNSFYWIVLQHYAVGFHREINLTTSHLSSHGRNKPC